MSASNLLVQAVGLIGTALYFLSFQCRRNRSLFRVQFLSYLFYTTHLLLLGAVTGGMSYIINTLRSLCLGSKWKFARTWAMCLIICLLQIATLIVTWSGWISLLPVAANIASTIGGYTHNPRTIRLAGLFINGAISFGSALAGLLAGAGVGLAILFRMHRCTHKNVAITALLYGIAVLCGILVNLVA